MPNANIHLVTAHAGQPHITTRNLVDLIVGLSGITNNVRRLKTPNEGLELTYSGMAINISVGAGIAGGYFFELNTPYNVTLEPGRNGYSRKDRIFVVIYENPENNVQSCDFEYVTGTEVANGNNATAPVAPTGPSISKTFVFAEITVKNNTVYEVTNRTSNYEDVATAVGLLSNRLSVEIHNIKENYDERTLLLTIPINSYQSTSTDSSRVNVYLVNNSSITVNENYNLTGESLYNMMNDYEFYEFQLANGTIVRTVNIRDMNMSYDHQIFIPYYSGHGSVSFIHAYTNASIVEHEETGEIEAYDYCITCNKIGANGSKVEESVDKLIRVVKVYGINKKTV